MRSKNWLSLVACLLIFFDFISAHNVTLITMTGDLVVIDSTLLEDSKSHLVKSGTFIDCPTIYKVTLERVSKLLRYKKEEMFEALIAYLKKEYANYQSLEIADVINTLAFFELENVLEQCLWHCPNSKQKTVFGLCSDASLKKIELFNNYVKLRMPLQSGLTRTVFIAAHNANLLPVVREMNDSFMDPEHKECYLDGKLREIVLPEHCVPVFNTLVGYENFLNVLFSAISNFESLAISDSPDYAAFFENLFDKPELQSTCNIAAFCNLLDFFEQYLFVDFALEYLALNEKNNNFAKRNIEKIKDTLSGDLHNKYSRIKTIQETDLKPTITPSLYNLWGLLK